MVLALAVSLSPFFALAFGFLFLVSGLAVGWQAIHEPSGSHTNRCVLGCFSVLTTLSGLVAFLLERDWSLGLSSHAKTPLYGMIGVSLAFSINFSALELLSKAHALVFVGGRGVGVGAVRNEWQVRLVAASSVLSGLLFGLTFGVMDLEDELVRSHLHFRVALERESRVCYPLGACAGESGSLLPAPCSLLPAAPLPPRCLPTRRVRGWVARRSNPGIPRLPHPPTTGAKGGLHASPLRGVRTPAPPQELSPR